jgi:ATP-dependent transcriptional regulator
MNESSLFHTQLLATKFFAPTASHALVHRVRLHTILRTGLKYPLTLVSAPAGFGKTTLLADWAQSLSHEDLQVAWLSLNEQDNNPFRFWTGFLTALERRQPAITPLLLSLQSQPSPSFETMLTTLINHMVQQDRQVLLIIDDYHLITEPAIHRLLTYLIENAPSQLRLILAARNDPPFPLYRLRARGQILEVHAEQLRCTPEESTAFLTDVMGLALTSQDLLQISERTEGWFVGLQLLALSVQGQTNMTKLLQKVSGSQQDILEYLTEEVLQQQSPVLQTFLLSTSILEQFSAPLCDALLEEHTGQQILDTLTHANLFLVALDAHGRWYRYHHLFAEALRYRLKQQHPQVIPTLYLRASQWYAQQGQSDEAIQYALRAKNWERVADLIEVFFRHLIWKPGAVSMMRRWIELLPQEIHYLHPHIGLFAAWILYLSDQLKESAPWLDIAETILNATVPHLDDAEAIQKARHQRAEIIARRAIIAGTYGDSQRASELCHQALALLLEQDHYEHALVATAQALIWLTSGNAKATAEGILEASQHYQLSDVIAGKITFLCLTSFYVRMQGKLQQAEEILAQARDVQSSASILSDLIGIVFVHQSALLYERNQVEAAMDLVLQGRHLIEQTGSIFFVDQAYLSLFRIYLARKELSAAENILSQLVHLPSFRNNPYRLAWQTAVEQVRLWLAQDKLSVASRWCEEQVNKEQQLPSFAQERIAVACVRVHLAEHHVDKALALLHTWLPHASAGERWEHVLEMRLLEALAYQMAGKEREALAALAVAVQLAEPEGYIRHFVDEGPQLATLLARYRELVHRQRSTTYLDTLLAAFSPSATVVQASPTAVHVAEAFVDQLSEREQEVLHLLAQGASNQEIAQTLFITLSTSKQHVHSILSKLGVGNRTQAVARARTLGLLSDAS